MGLKDKTRTNALTRDCLILLNAFGFMAWRQNNTPAPVVDPNTKEIIGVRTMPYGSRKGVPDIIVVSKPHGTFIGIEIKVGKDRLSENQIEFKNDLLKFNAKYYVVTEIQDLITLINDDKLRHLPENNTD